MGTRSPLYCGSVPPAVERTRALGERFMKKKEQQVGMPTNLAFLVSQVVPGDLRDQLVRLGHLARPFLRSKR